jgi:hypothetical protein
MDDKTLHNKQTNYFNQFVYTFYLCLLPIGHLNIFTAFITDDEL